MFFRDTFSAVISKIRCEARGRLAVPIVEAEISTPLPEIVRFLSMVIWALSVILLMFGLMVMLSPSCER